ncbi:hypothetical protein IE077_002057 [Cardiosporidium cionae]|uniref:Uncharacterized protein n=1 Tax=Cardiosporidium cionae TaxID=476202 RepID=A0ABQ7JFX3_9APIC|nr:hypothetical protein IE077_002057 [Cardiosporidium cionae]|eukprot:KAF8822917.1 hypothetical protein IE077_002057 [Cardiosporidium cionae]
MADQRLPRVTHTQDESPNKNAGTSNSSLHVQQNQMVNTNSSDPKVLSPMVQENVASVAPYDLHIGEKLIAQSVSFGTTSELVSQKHSYVVQRPQGMSSFKSVNRVCANTKKLLLLDPDDAIQPPCEAASAPIQEKPGSSTKTATSISVGMGSFENGSNSTRVAPHLKRPSPKTAPDGMALSRGRNRSSLGAQTPPADNSSRNFAAPPSMRSGYMQTRLPSRGSETMVEWPTTYQPSRNSEPLHLNFATPVLRLQVNANTQQVSLGRSGEKVSDENQDTSSQVERVPEKRPLPSISLADFHDAPPSTDQSSPRSNGRFFIRKNDSTITVIDNDEFIEEYDTLPSGVSWGEKRAKDQRWRENWLQQETKVSLEDGSEIKRSFGEKCGEDSTKHQRWTEKWNHVGTQVDVERNVEQFHEEDPSTVYEKWQEMYSCDTEKGVTSIYKQGEDRQAHPYRKWKTHIEMQKENDETTQWDEVFEENFEGTTQSGFHRRLGKNNVSDTKTWYKENQALSEDVQPEEWEEEFHQNATGYKWGEKHGCNPQGEEWYERWFESEKGDREVDQWTFAEDRHYGEKQGYSTETKEEYNEEWERTKSKDFSNRTLNKWWKRPEEGTQWSEKDIYKEWLASSESQVEKAEEIKEKTYDNKDERLQNSWTISSEYTPAEESAERRLVRQVKQGTTHGYRHENTHEWHDSWYEVYELALEEGEDSTSLDAPSMLTASGLILRRRSYEKWWKEGENLRKGEKRYQSFETGEDTKEEWQEDEKGNIKTERSGILKGGNPSESSDWFYDSFGECRETQEQWAYKKGGNTKGDTWTEKWNEFPYQKSASKSGRNAKGDVWEESWKESQSSSPDKIQKFAVKTGANKQGDTWQESWMEECDKKYARKQASRSTGEQWMEEWGENFDEDGSGQKWTSQWAEEADGKRHGKNWGDSWGKEGMGGHRWGEEWTDEDIKKWCIPGD